MPALRKPNVPRLRPGHQFARGLIRAHLFHEGRGGLTHDIIAAANVGTLTATPVWVSGPRGPAIKFTSASSQYISAAAVPALSNFSILTSVYDTGSGNRTIVAQGNAGASALMFYLRAADLGFTSSGFKFINYTLPANRWVRIAAIYDGAALRVYLDGKLSASGAASGVPDSGGSFTISRLGGFAGQYWDGQISEVKVYNRALSAAEIALDYARVDPFSEFRAGVRPLVLGIWPPAATAKAPPPRSRPLRIWSRVA